MKFCSFSLYMCSECLKPDEFIYQQESIPAFTSSTTSTFYVIILHLPHMNYLVSEQKSYTVTFHLVFHLVYIILSIV